MSSPTSLDLTTVDHPWRATPMPGSNGDIELVRLASTDRAFTILGRFAPGFERSTPGGYLCSEELLMLDGELELEGRTYVRGDLAVVPAGFVRTSMRSPRGCRLLAWFGGAAIFREPSELGAPPARGIESVATHGASGPLLSSSVGSWSTELPSEGTVDVVGPGLRWWRRGEAREIPADAELVRLEPTR
jgi:hypothetical protein